jgi:hypothetical protein
VKQSARLGEDLQLQAGLFGALLPRWWGTRGRSETLFTLDITVININIH